MFSQDFAKQFSQNCFSNFQKITIFLEFFQDFLKIFQFSHNFQFYKYFYKFSSISIF